MRDVRLWRNRSGVGSISKPTVEPALLRKAALLLRALNLTCLLLTDNAALCGTLFDEGDFRQREIAALSSQFGALPGLDDRLAKSSEVLRATTAPLDHGVAYDNALTASRVCEEVMGMASETRVALEQVERQVEARRHLREARQAKEEAWKAEVSSEVQRVRQQFEQEQVSERRNKAVTADAKVDLTLSGLNHDAFSLASNTF
jgi:hypothetical protein